MKRFTIKISMRTCRNGFLNFCSSVRQWCKKNKSIFAKSVILHHIL